MGKLPRADAIVIQIEGGLEYTVASRFLPTVGSRIDLSRLSVEVTEVSFFGREHLESMSGLSGSKELLGEESDYLTPLIKARRVD